MFPFSYNLSRKFLQHSTIGLLNIDRQSTQLDRSLKVRESYKVPMNLLNDDDDIVIVNVLFNYKFKSIK